MDNVEIEFRFVVTQIDPDFRRSPRVAIEQGYLESPPGTSLRVRISTDLQGTRNAVITRKAGRGLVREECEHAVSVEAAETLLRSCFAVLHKTRYAKDGWTVDVFDAPLPGLIIAEKELASEQAWTSLPPWIGKARDVTDSLTNLHLAYLVRDLAQDLPERPVRELLPTAMKRIVLTGGPCSGKSALMALLKKEFGAAVHCVPEVATTLIAQVGIRPSTEALAARRFQRVVARVQRSFEEASADQALRDGKRALLLDRGLMDNAAYLQGGVSELMEVLQSQTGHEFGQYDAVVWLCPPPPEIYARDRTNNPARAESYAEAVVRGTRVREAWADHPRLVCVEDTSWEDKVARVRRHVADLLG
ncbi:hypothetical protein EPO33_04325 [Patescibacteria group bacterium]|nr:MAG: hypothetical protein EPO33_04325 [Patescibacteria group bacterium]